MKINFDIIVSTINETIFKKINTLKLRESFIKNGKEKSSWLENNINWFFKKLKLSDNEKSQDFYKSTFHKWSIYYVNYGINIWSEINGNRPSIMIKDTFNTYWKDLIVIPLTSFSDDKSRDKFDIFIKSWNDNNLDNDSIIKVRYMKNISKNRIWSFVWFVNDEEIRNKINKNIIKMFSLK